MNSLTLAVEASLLREEQDLSVLNLANRAVCLQKQFIIISLGDR